METPLRILIVEDAEEDALRVDVALRKAGIIGELHRVESRDQFLRELKSAPPDIIVSDDTLTSFSGRDALALAHDLAPEIPFIVVSGEIGEETAPGLIQAGATDFVLKNRLHRIGAAVRRALRERQDRKQKSAFEAELRRSHQQLQALAARLETFREEERTRIARELHDELGQSLTALKLDIEWIRRHLEAEQTGLVRKANAMSDLIDRTTQTMRRIATELRPNVLDDLGLHAAIEWMARDTEQRTGIICTVTVLRTDLPPRCSAFSRKP
jgi:signal transduction histidine kinase